MYEYFCYIYTARSRTLFQTLRERTKQLLDYVHFVLLRFNRFFFIHASKAGLGMALAASLLFHRGGHVHQLRKCPHHQHDLRRLRPPDVPIRDPVFWRRYLDRQRERRQDLIVLLTAPDAENLESFYGNSTGGMLDVDVFL